jgi:hypothetical protein
MVFDHWFCPVHLHEYPGRPQCQILSVLPMTLQPVAHIYPIYLHCAEMSFRFAACNAKCVSYASISWFCNHKDERSIKP